MTDTDTTPAEPERVEQNPIQDLFARWLDNGGRTARWLLLTTFAVYVSGLLPSDLPAADAPAYWALSASQYVRATGSTAGWGWLAHLGRGDRLALLGIVLVPSLSALCYVRVLPRLIRARDLAMALMVLAQIVVLILAASGIVRAGG